VLGIRPWGRSALRVAAVASRRRFRFFAGSWDLPDLDRETLLALVREELGSEFAEYAESLVRGNTGFRACRPGRSATSANTRDSSCLACSDAEFAYAVLADFVMRYSESWVSQ